MYIKNKINYWFFMFLTIICTINTKLYAFKITNKIKYKNIFKKYNNNHKYNNKIKSIRYLDVSLIKCKTTDEIGLKNLLCIECNIDKGYYPITYNYHKNSNSEKYFKYKDCYNKDTIPNNYYFNSDKNVYEECYESCETCEGYGDQNNNNCLSCKFNYINMPEFNNTKNCLIKCPYYYHYSLTGEYFCTENFNCPEKNSFIIEGKSKCIYDCKMDDNYKYQYNGECLQSCPENTYPNELNICLDNDIEKCTLITKNTKMIGSLLTAKQINEMAKIFAKEFNYNNNHVSQFIADNYTILFYKNKSCISEKNLSNSIIDFDECLSKIYYYLNISSPLIVVIDRIGKYNNPTTNYAFFDPFTGDKLNTSFCENTFILIKRNMSYLNKSEYNYLIEQNVDLFNINSSFYKSNCFPFKSAYKKDLILKDRIIYIYPNVSVCEKGCEYENTNYKTFITKCKCIYNDTNYNSINVNIREDEIFKLENDILISLLKEIRDIIENTKIHYLWCYKKVFTFKYIIRNLGGFIILVLLIIQIICIILLIKNNSFNQINRFILILTDIYIEYKTKKNKLQSIQKKRYKKNNLLNKHKIKTEPIKNTHKKNKNNIIKNVEKELKNTNNLYSSDNSRKQIETLGLTTKKINEKKDVKKDKRRSSIFDINRNNYLKKFTTLHSSFTVKDMKEYLSTSPDEMDFYEVLKKDNRTFCIFLLNIIVKKQIFVYTFYSIEETIPIYLKIILLTLYINLIFFSVVLFFSTKDIKAYFNLNKSKYIVYHIKHFSYRITICFSVIAILKFVIEFFLVDKESIKSIIKREKEDLKVLKKEMIKFIKLMKVFYILFIIINIIFTLISWYIISCFNNAYPYTKIFWFMLSLVTIVVAQILPIGLAFVETCLRFFAIKLKINCIFVLSKYIGSFI